MGHGVNRINPFISVIGLRKSIKAWFLPTATMISIAQLRWWQLTKISRTSFIAGDD